MRRAYKIAAEEEEIVVRFDRRLVDRGSVKRFLDYLEMESLRQRAGLTEEQVAALAEDIDTSVWEQVRHKYAEE